MNTIYESHLNKELFKEGHKKILESMEGIEPIFYSIDYTISDEPPKISFQGALSRTENIDFFLKNDLFEKDFFENLSDEKEEYYVFWVCYETKNERVVFHTNSETLSELLYKKYEVIEKLKTLFPEEDEKYDLF